MNASLSVILCTHNPRPDYLCRVLDALQVQTIPPDQWELLVVDNASEKRLAEAFDLSWHAFARHIREDQLGLTAARLRGIAESRGELLVFVDDDNVLAPDFLEQARHIALEHPFLGVFGPGSLDPEFEREPPREFMPRLSILAVRSVSSVRWSNNARDSECVPWGAGLCVTRRAAHCFQRLVERLNITAVLGRRGEQLFACEDEVFAWASSGSGTGFGLFPELRITHLLAGRRLNRRYFLQLAQGHAFSHSVLFYLLAGIEPRRFDLGRCLRVVLDGFKEGPFSMRYRWAVSWGEDGAARFISQNGLAPIKATPLDSFGCEPGGNGSHPL
jgi:glycosyltransferase involved in cell wall biosynthesis